MEYEITLTVRVDADYFYQGLTVRERQTLIAEAILNSIYDIDDITLKSIPSIRAEELDIT